MLLFCGMMSSTNTEKKGGMHMAGKKLEDTKKASRGWTATKGIFKGQEKVVSIDGVGKYADYKFEVARKKDKQTGQEMLSITAFHKEGAWEDYGTLITGIAKLDSDIKKLNDYGINLLAGDFLELVKVIRDYFYELPLDKIDRSISVNDLDDITAYFKEYIKSEKIEKKGGCYNIVVDDFKKEYEQSTFSHDIKDVVDALRLQGYIQCNPNRKNRVVKMDDGKGKTVGKRCISFTAEKIGEVEYGE